MSEILLSVVIPHYNSPDALRKLILSIPDRPEVQVVVVDDNSTKELERLEQVRCEMNGRVEFFRNETGIQSAGACRNTGMEKAVGKWILFADADDYFLPGMYETVSEYFDSSYDMVIFCPTSAYIGSGEPAGRHQRHEQRIRAYLADPTRENYLSLCRTTTIWSKLIRRSVIEENQIRCSTSMHGNDFLCSQKLFFFCKEKKVVTDVIYCITQGENSLTTSVSELSFENSVKERTKGYLFDRSHYSKKDLYAIDLSGGETLLRGLRRHAGFKKLFWGFRYFRKNRVHIIPRRLLKWKNLRRYMKDGYLV